MSPGERNNHPHPLIFFVPQGRNREHRRVVIRVEFQLFAISADGLAEVALLVKQAYGHHGDTKIAGGLKKIPGQYAQPATVERQRLAQPVLHAEIGDALAQVSRALRGIPGVGPDKLTMG